MIPELHHIYVTAIDVALDTADGFLPEEHCLDDVLEAVGRGYE
jgi:hypothetical protein